MSNPSLIYDRILTELAGVLTSYVRLPNAYDTEVNPSIVMSKAYGIAFMGGTDTKRFQGCKISERHTYDIIILHQISATDNQTTPRDTVIKTMLDDMHLVLEWFNANKTLNSLAANVNIGDLSGIEYVQSGQTRHYKITRPIEVEFFD